VHRVRGPTKPGVVRLLTEVGEQRDRVRERRAVLETEDGEPAHRLVGIVVGERVEEGAIRVDEPGMVTGEELERQERRAAAGRALVVQAAS
jgi:hypothetical protein